MSAWLQHAKLPCPPISPRVCSNSYPLSWRCYITISSFANLFSSHLQSFPASGSFPVSWLFTSGGQSIRASASLLLMSIQGYYHLGLTNLISLKDSQESSPAPQFKDINSPALSLLYGCESIQLSHPYIGKIIPLTILIFVNKVMSLLLNTLSRFVGFSSKE